MNYREALKNSLGTFETGEFISPDGTKQESNEVLPICFATFLKTIGGFEYLLAKQYLENDFSKGIFSLAGEINKKGQPATMESLIVDNTIHSAFCFSILGGFWPWLLNHECPESENDPLYWAHLDCMIDLYNEYISERG